MAKDTTADVEYVEPYCDGCLQKMKKESHSAVLIMEACIGHTKTVDYEFIQPLIWD